MVVKTDEPADDSSHRLETMEPVQVEALLLQREHESFNHPGLNQLGLSERMALQPKSIGSIAVAGQPVCGVADPAPIR
jgi:hypothetical protein